MKILPVVEEFTRESLSTDVERHITARALLASLQQRFESSAVPDFICSDNGPEFTSAAVKEWLSISGVKALFIEPGSPWETAFSLGPLGVETFNSRPEDELLNRKLFGNLTDGKAMVEPLRVSYYND